MALRSAAHRRAAHLGAPAALCLRMAAGLADHAVAVWRRPLLLFLRAAKKNGWRSYQPSRRTDAIITRAPGRCVPYVIARIASIRSCVYWFAPFPGGRQRKRSAQRRRYERCDGVGHRRISSTMKTGINSAWRRQQHRGAWRRAWTMAPAAPFLSLPATCRTYCCLPSAATATSSFLPPSALTFSSARRSGMVT